MGSLLGRGELEERDPIVLAQFAGGDTALAGAVTEAFRVDFEQSPVVRLVAPQQVADVLRRMQRDPGDPVTEALALEIAEREGYKAILTGEVNAIGGGYVLSARLLAADGRVLTSTRETATDSTGVLTAIDALSKTMRERIGESLRTIRANQPLDQLTTSSLEALRKYSQADRARNDGDPFRALELLQQAVEIDPEFAMAWRKMAAILVGPGMDQDRLVAAATRAYELRDRLTEKESHLAAAAYNDWVVGDIDAAVRAYRSVLDVNPDETTALNNLANILSRRGDYEEAARLTARAMELGGSMVFYNNHAAQLHALGREDEGIAILERARTMYPENQDPGFLIAVHRAARGEYEAADSAVTAALSQRLSAYDRGGYLWLGSALDAVKGRRRAAIERTRVMERETRPFGSSEALGSATWRARLMLALHMDTAAVLAELEDALERYPLDAMEPLQRPYVALAELNLRVGRRERATALLAERAAELPAGQRGSSETGAAFVRAMLRLEEGDVAGADNALAEVHANDDCDVCGLDRVARRYADAGERARAIALYERFLDTRFAWRAGEADAVALPDVLQHLAQLYDEAGDTEAAARTYARFVELWQDADPELQPRVRAARERLEAIVRRRG